MSFWANKLNGTPPPAPVLPSRDLYVMYKPPGQSLQIDHIPEKPLPTEGYTPSVRLKQGSICPDCGSDKYMPYGSYAIACGECGYHPRFEQSGHGERSLQTKPGVATPARQPGDHQTMAGSIALLNAGGGDHIANI